MEFLNSVGLNLEDIIPQVGDSLGFNLEEMGELESTEEVVMEEESQFPDDYDEYGGDVLYVQEEEEDPLPQVDEEYSQQPENQPAPANQQNQRVQQVNRGYAPRQANQQNQRRPANRNYAPPPPVEQAYSGVSLQDMYPQMIEAAGNLMGEENNCQDEHEEYDNTPEKDEENHFAEETYEDQEEYDEYPQEPETVNQEDPLQPANQQNQGAPMNPQSQRTRMNQQSQQPRVNQQSQRARMNQQSQQLQGNRQSQRTQMNQHSQRPRVLTQGNRPRQQSQGNQQNQQPRMNQQSQQPRANPQGRPPANQQNQYRVHPTTLVNQPTQSPVPAHGYPLVVPQGQGAWSTNLFDCSNDVPLLCLTCWCPCITFGRIAEIVEKGSSTCGTAGGIYSLILLFTGCHFIYSGGYRTKMRLQYGIPGDDAEDFCTHFWCESCSLVQEYKELTARGYDVPLGWHGNINLARQKQAQGIQMAPKAPNGMTR